MNKNQNSPADAENFADLIKGQRFVMFTTRSNDGVLSSRPMTIAEREDSLFRFVTQADTQVAVEADGQLVNLAVMDGGSYVSMAGTARVERDLAKKQELWNRIQEAYAGDVEDPNNVILEVTVDSAEYWDSGNQVSTLISLAKAAVTGERPHDGEHGTVEL